MTTAAADTTNALRPPVTASRRADRRDAVRLWTPGAPAPPLWTTEHRERAERWETQGPKEILRTARSGPFSLTVNMVPCVHQMRPHNGHLCQGGKETQKGSDKQWWDTQHNGFA